MQHQWVYVDGRWHSETNSCLGNTLSTIMEIHHYRKTGNSQRFLAYWIYGNRAPHHLQSDDGMIVEEALEMLQLDGVIPSDTAISYNLHYFDFDGYTGAKNKVAQMYDSKISIARQYRVGSYSMYEGWKKPLTSYETLEPDPYVVTTVQNAIVDDGAVLLNFWTFSEFYNIPSSGIVPYVDLTNDDYIVGHAMALIGWKYINGKLHWIAQNSWDSTWGNSGRCYIPFDHRMASLSWFYTIKQGTSSYTRPSNWSWATSKVAGSTFNITATEWNNFCTRINEFRRYKLGLGNDYTFTTAYKGNAFTAAMYNQARNAINVMNPSTSIPVYRNKGDTIYASDINRLRDSLNSIA